MALSVSYRSPAPPVAPPARAPTPPESGGAGGFTGSGGNGGTIINPGDSGVLPGGGGDNNPETCADAAANRTYIGCDFWPTVTFNPVYTDFKFAVVIANGGGSEASVKVARGGTEIATVTVPPGGLTSVPLPWVPELKGEEFARSDTNTGARKKTSVLVPGGAYHLTSSIPVTVWQFSPLDYQQPAANCPGLPPGTTTCLSVSNDASLLLPTTAMTGNYRLFGRSARLEGGGELWTSSQGAFAITATQNDTMVKLQLTAARMVQVGAGAQIGAAQIAAGNGVNAAMPGETVTYALQAGDVVELAGVWAPFEPEPHGDLSGSILNANKPVQVIALNALLNGVPTATDGNPDHIEETVLPAEVIGKSYVVAAPTGPDKRVPRSHGALLRQRGPHHAHLSDGCSGRSIHRARRWRSGGNWPADHGVRRELRQTVRHRIHHARGNQTGSRRNARRSFAHHGGHARSSSASSTRSSRRRATSRTTRTFSYPSGATVTLDGKTLAAGSETVGTWTVAREKLENGDKNGAHHLESTSPVGLQVMGFGAAHELLLPGGPRPRAHQHAAGNPMSGRHRR